MKITAKFHYGLIVLIELTINVKEKGIQQRELSSNLNISLKFLDAVLSSLKTAGLIYRLMGNKSGYKLTTDPSEITIYQVYRAFEPKLTIYPCLIGNKLCKKDSLCGSHHFLEKFNMEMENFMLSYTIKMLADFQLENMSKIQPLLPL